MEWVVVTVVIALVGFVATIVKPVVSLTRSITELTVVVKGLRSDMDDMREHSRETHQKLWDHNEVQDEHLADHERRIGILENK